MELGLASVEFDNLLFFEEFGEIFSLGERNDFSGEIDDIGFDVDRNCGSFKVVVLGDVSALLSVSDGDDVTNSAGVARDVHEFAVHKDVLVGDHLPGLENGACISESIDLGLESHFQESQEVETVVALHAACSFKRFAELLFEHSVIPSDNLLGEKLLTVFGHSSVAHVGAVLAGGIRSFG